MIHNHIYRPDVVTEMEKLGAFRLVGVVVVQWW
jgi:hypothetical protein